MKPTLNEEIGMSKQGIDYVNSLEPSDDDAFRCAEEAVKTYIDSIEVKEPEVQRKYSERNTSITDLSTYSKSISNNIPEEMEQQRIKRQGRNALIFVLIIIALTFITNYFNK